MEIAERVHLYVKGRTASILNNINCVMFIFKPQNGILVLHRDIKQSNLRYFQINGFVQKIIDEPNYISLEMLYFPVYFFSKFFLPMDYFFLTGIIPG